MIVKFAQPPGVAPPPGLTNPFALPALPGTPGGPPLLSGAYDALGGAGPAPGANPPAPAHTAALTPPNPLTGTNPLGQPPGATTPPAPAALPLFNNNPLLSPAAVDSFHAAAPETPAPTWAGNAVRGVGNLIRTPLGELSLPPAGTPGWARSTQNLGGSPTDWTPENGERGSVGGTGVDPNELNPNFGRRAPEVAAPHLAQAPKMAPLPVSDVTLRPTLGDVVPAVTGGPVVNRLGATFLGGSARAVPPLANFASQAAKYDVFTGVLGPLRNAGAAGANLFGRGGPNVTLRSRLGNAAGHVGIGVPATFSAPMAWHSFDESLNRPGTIEAARPGVTPPEDPMRIRANRRAADPTEGAREAPNLAEVMPHVATARRVGGIYQLARNTFSADPNAPGLGQYTSGNLRQTGNVFTNMFRNPEGTVGRGARNVTEIGDAVAAGRDAAAPGQPTTPGETSASTEYVRLRSRYLDAVAQYRADVVANRPDALARFQTTSQELAPLFTAIQGPSPQGAGRGAAQRQFLYQQAANRFRADPEYANDPAALADITRIQENAANAFHRPPVQAHDERYIHAPYATAWDHADVAREFGQGPPPSGGGLFDRLRDAARSGSRGDVPQNAATAAAVAGRLQPQLAPIQADMRPILQDAAWARSLESEFPLLAARAREQGVPFAAYVQHTHGPQGGGEAQLQQFERELAAMQPGLPPPPQPTPDPVGGLTPPPDVPGSLPQQPPAGPTGGGAFPPIPQPAEQLAPPVGTNPSVPQPGGGLTPPPTVPGPLPQQPPAGPTGGGTFPPIPQPGGGLTPPPTVPGPLPQQPPAGPTGGGVFPPIPQPVEQLAPPADANPQPPGGVTPRNNPWRNAPPEVQAEVQQAGPELPARVAAAAGVPVDALAGGVGVAAALGNAGNLTAPAGFKGYWAELPPASKILAVAGLSMAAISFLRSAFSSGDKDDEPGFLSRVLPYLGLGAAAWGLGGGTLWGDKGVSMPQMSHYQNLGNAFRSNISDLGLPFGPGPR